MDIPIKWFYRLGFLLLLFVVLYIFWKLRFVWLPVLEIFLKILSPFLIAAFITYLLNPIIERLHVRGLNRVIAILIIYGLFFGGLGFSLYKGIPIFVEELRDFSNNAPIFTTQYREWLEKIQKETASWPNGLQVRVDEGIEQVEVKVEKFVDKVVNSLLNLLNASVLIGLIPFIAFYMLKDVDVLKKSVWYMSPRKWRQKGMSFLKDVDESLGAYIRGQILICVVIGVVSAMLFWMVNLKYALLLGFIIGITNVIPYFGPIIGAFPAVMIAATTSTKMVIITLIVIFVLQFVEGNLLGPIIVGKTLQMHPLVIMLALLIGGELGGIVGLILIVPLFAIMKVAMIHARNHFIFTNKVGTSDKD